MGVMSIPECIEWEKLKGMAAQWPSLLLRVRALEAGLGISEPPCERYKREARKGVMCGISLEDFDQFEILREVNSEFLWAKARIASIAAALDASAGVVRLNQRRCGRAA